MKWQRELLLLENIERLLIYAVVDAGAQALIKKLKYALLAVMEHQAKSEATTGRLIMSEGKE